MGTAFTTAVGAVFSTIGDVVTLITDKPLLLIPVAAGFAALGIKLGKRLMRARG